MKSGSWPKRLEDGARRLLEPQVAVIRHGEDEPPKRPHVFKITDENGNEREIYARPGHVTRRLW